MPKSMIQSQSLLSETRLVTSSFLRKKLKKEITSAEVVQLVSDDNQQWTDYFECNKCKKVYLGPASYIMHAELCSMTLPNQQSVESLAVLESVADELHCLICEDIFCGSSDLESHLIKHSNSWDFKMCHICSFSSLGSWIEYQQHMRVAHKNHENTLCDLCSKDGVYTNYCDICQTNVESHDILLLHKREHKIVSGPNSTTLLPFTNTEQNLRCIVCKSEFTLINQLYVHLEIHLQEIDIQMSRIDATKNGSKQRKHECHICDFKAITKIELKQHLRQIHDIKIILPSSSDSNGVGGTQLNLSQCSFCGKLFKTASGLRSHIKRFHVKNFYTCDICNRQFCIKFEIKEHLLTEHMNLKLFVCNVCGKVSKNRSLHRVHNETHLKVKKYLCTSCGKEFSQSAGLCIHSRNEHNENKNFPCRWKNCGKVFAKAVSRYTHEYAHKNPEALTCKLCNHTFTQRSALNTHNKSRHPEVLKNQVKQFVCAECGKAYPVKQYLLNHLVSFT